MTFKFLLDVSPRLEALWRESLTQGSIAMATIAEFKAQVLGQIQQLAAASADEHTQVLAAIDALKNHVADVVDDADVTEVMAAFDAAKAGISTIFEPGP